MRLRSDFLFYLVILWSKLVQAFLNNMVSVQVLDQHHYVKAECNNDSMNLSIVSKISLLSLLVSVMDSM
jgi:hypothetical protein